MGKREQEQHFEEIYRQNYLRLFRYAFNIVGDYDVARDIVSDVMITVWNNIDSIDAETQNAYLMTSVRNRCVDRLRNIEKEQRYSEHYMHEASIFYTDYGDELEKDQLVEQMFAVLSPPTDKILRMCYFERMKYKEVAEMLRISESTVKKHIMKALKTLRELYNNKKSTRKTN